MDENPTLEDGGTEVKRNGFDRPAAYELVALIGGLILFVLLLLQVLFLAESQRITGPALTAFVGAILLWPLRKQPVARALLLAGSFLLLIWFFDQLSGVLAPFVIVYLLAFLFDPVVTYLQKERGVPRWVSSFVMTGLLVGFFLAVIFLLVPSVIGQIEELATRIVSSVGYLRTWLVDSAMLDQLERSGVVNKNDLIAQVTAAIQEQAGRITTSLPNLLQNVFGYIGSILGLITVLTIIPVIHFYTLKDYPYIKRRLVELFPTFGGERDYLVKASGVLGNYLRGQITISAIAAFNVSVVLLIFGVPFSLLIGLLTGILNMVPNLGALLTMIIGLLIATVFGDPWFLDALVVALTLFGQSLLEQSFLTPKILSSQVGLHPVLILLSLFVFGSLLGIIGFLIAVPATALIMVFYKSFRRGLTLELAPAKTPPARKLFRRVIRRERVEPGESNGGPAEVEHRDRPDQSP